MMQQSKYDDCRFDSLLGDDLFSFPCSDSPVLSCPGESKNWAMCVECVSYYWILTLFK